MDLRQDVVLRFSPRQKEKSVALTSQFVSVGLFVVWCLANSLYAADAHTLLHTSNHAHLYVELTLCHIHSKGENFAHQINRHCYSRSRRINVFGLQFLQFSPVLAHRFCQYRFPFEKRTDENQCISPPIPFDLISKLLSNSCYFAAYQMASIALLARLDSLTHAVANLFKRFSSIFFTAVFLHTVDFLPRHIIGLALTFTGFPLYALGGFIDSNMKLRKKVRTIAKSLFYPLACFLLFISGFSSGQIVPR